MPSCGSSGELPLLLALMPFPVVTQPIMPLTYSMATHVPGAAAVSSSWLSLYLSHIKVLFPRSHQSLLPDCSNWSHMGCPQCVTPAVIWRVTKGHPLYLVPVQGLSAQQLWVFSLPAPTAPSLDCFLLCLYSFLLFPPCIKEYDYRKPLCSQPTLSL